MKTNRAVAVALVVGLVAGAGGGFAFSHRKHQRDLTTLAFVDAVGRISTSTTTLRMIERQQMAKAARLNEMVFRSSVADAARYTEDLPMMSQSTPNLRRSIADAEAYAIRHNWTNLPPRLREIQKALPVAP